MADSLSMRPLLMSLLLTLACSRNSDPSAGTPVDSPAAAPDPNAPSGPEQASPQPATPEPRDAMLEWLDPDAIAVAYARLPAGIDMDGLTTVFATPPKLAGVLKDVGELDAALDAILPPEAPRPSQWLGPETLALTPPMATGTYLLRPLLVPAAQVRQTLLTARMRTEEVEGMTVLIPMGPFPYRVAFLNEHVVAFVPVREIGTGLSPLTAGRDLPAGPMEQELTRALEQDQDLVVALYGAGPLLHFDLRQDVAQFALLGRTWPPGGLDVSTRLVPEGDLATAASALGHRDVALETDGVAALCQRVAYTMEGERVAGRLQLTANDLAVLGVAP